MMTIMEAIGFAIDFMVILIQVPYIFIAGFIIGWTYCPYVGSNYIYVWYPTDGVIKMWMRPNGDITYDLVTYKELFH